MKNLKKAVKFLKEIEGSTGIFFHRDTDGVCSAAQMIKFLKGKKIKPELFCGGYDEQ
ncbi:MAG: hypothetical protein ISS95_01135, partial [Candidatus Aenigmarchaeota archaeon]|nr:hypothetical protein [Candidatus Aenigmarchaeota archaeon]